MTEASSPLRRLAMKAVLAAREVADLGPSTSAAIAAHSVRMEVRHRRARKVEASPAVTRGPGRLLSAEVLEPARPAGVRCWFAEADLEVRFLTDDVVRLTWGPGEIPAERPAPFAPETVTTTVAGSDAPASTGAPAIGAVTAATGALRVVVSPDGGVRFFGPAGGLFRRELPPLRRGASRSLHHLHRAGERVAGLGEQAAPVDLRGTSHRLWNRDPGGAWGPGQDPLYCGIPVTVGMHPDGDVLVFYENTYDARVRIGRAGTEITFAGGALRHYVITGPLPHLLDRYSALTGRPPLPPRWSLGYHQSKWGYRTDTDIREVAAGFRDEGVPLSAVHLDIDYMDGYRVFTVDQGRFPDLGGLATELGRRGTHLVAIVDPGVKADPDYDVFREGVEGDRFLEEPSGRPHLGVVWPGRSAFPDFTDPSTRKWWGGWYARLLDVGVAGIWHDMNEPTSITLWGDRTLPRDTRHAAGDHRRYHNVYGLEMNRAGWEAQAEQRPDRRPWLLSRAGWAGTQRWAWNWTGDVESSWSGLAQQVPTTIGLGLSGVPFTGSDIGGFSGVPGPELYLRWLEMSVLMPFCRTHCVMGSPNREPWRFPEPYRSAIDRLIRFRYRLLPYLYTLAEEAHRSGHPLVRPLCWDESFRGGRLEPVDDAYLLGDCLLVAPVAEEGARTRTVPLPDGDWYRWRPVPGIDDGAGIDDEVGAAESQPSSGGVTVRVDAPAGQPVILVRAGSILPLDDGWNVPDGLLTPGHEPRMPAFHCFPAADGSARGKGYDDAGDGSGPGREDLLELRRASGGKRMLSWRRRGDYPPPPRIRVVLHGPAPMGMDSAPFDELLLR